MRQGCHGKLEEAENGGEGRWRQFHREELNVSSLLVWMDHFSVGISVKDAK